MAAFQPLTRDLVRTKANIQVLDLENERAENIAEFSIAKRWNGYLNIVGTAQTAEAEVSSSGGSNSTPATAADKVNVTFSEFVLKIGGWQTKVPLGSIKPRGWVQTTYLDEDFRVGRGDKGSIFVAARTKPGQTNE